MFVGMCACLSGWPARTFGCTPLPWRITGSGRSRASAWQCGRGLRITAGTGGVCADVYMCAGEYLCMCPRVRVSESSEETADPSSHKANHFCDPPQNCPVFDARRWLCCCLHRPAGKMTMSLWCCLEEGKRGTEKEVGGRASGEDRPIDEGEQGEGIDRKEWERQAIPYFKI